MKLPDKGDRIQKLYENIVAELNARDDIDQAATLFSELNIVEKGVKVVTQMEWNGGKVKGDQVLVAAETLDSDDDENEVDPLKVIAQNRNIKLVKVTKPPKSLITEADLQDIKAIEAENKIKKSQNVISTNTSSETASDETDDVNKTSDLIELEPHAINMMKKDKAFDKNVKVKEKFLPFRTTKSDVHSVNKEKQRKPGKHWEITAATPPILRNNSAKLISLQESIDMERQHKEKLREQMEKQAVERLATRKKIIAANISLLPIGSTLLDPNAFFQSYRQRETQFEENDETDGDLYSENSDDDGEEPDSHGISVVIND